MDFSVSSKRTKIIKVVIIIFGVLLLFVIICLALYISLRGSLPPLERAKKILAEAPLIDGHNGFPMSIRVLAENNLHRFNLSRNLSQDHYGFFGHRVDTDIPRLREGKVGAQIWSAYADCVSQHKDAVVITLEQIDVIKRMIDTYSDDLELVTESEGILKAVEKGKIGSLISIGGGHSIQYSLAVLRTFYTLGARIMDLTTLCSTPWAQYYNIESYNKSAKLDFNQGLSSFGEEVIREMNRLGMIIDVSHTSLATMKDAIQLSQAPVIFSRSAAKYICDIDINVPDDVLRLIRQKEGLIMISLFPDYIKCRPNSGTTIEDVIKQLDHLRSRATVNSIGIGSSFGDMDEHVEGLSDVSKFPLLFEALIKSGNWTDEDLEKLAGKNFLRVFRAVEDLKEELESKGTKPYQAWIKKSELKKFTNTSCSGTGLQR
ncbi:unnamed protein product [Allacma fusca]|uniref:Dipeptidase n=1 Tax=Allacma fusca TaxID=39272 RepID=A0A8J2L217_9HEXA|nr:unnamed protein product [Allacma fusca]